MPLGSGADWAKAIPAIPAAITTANPWRFMRIPPLAHPSVSLFRASIPRGTRKNQSGNVVRRAVGSGSYLISSRFRTTILLTCPTITPDIPPASPLSEDPPDANPLLSLASPPRRGCRVRLARVRRPVRQGPDLDRPDPAAQADRPAIADGLPEQPDHSRHGRRGPVD